MKPLHHTDSTDIAQICRNSDGRFDDLWTGEMAEPERGFGELAGAVAAVFIGAVVAIGAALWVLA